MSKISCNVIQDIMPLYVDEIVSEDTKKLVEEHLKECEDCRKEMEKMRAKIILPNKKKISYAGSDSAGSVFCNPVTVGEGAEKREIAMVYLNRNLWSTYIQPHLQEQNEDEMIYLGKAADMDIIYYGKFDVENFYEKIPEILKEMTPIWKK